MPRAVVFGCNGYIGLAAAIALRRRGYEVHGIIRSAKSSAELHRNEIHAVVANYLEPKQYETLLERSSVVVDTILDWSGGDAAARNRIILDATVEAGKRARRTLKYLYCSGCLVYGENEGAILDEEDPVKNVDLKWRIDWEQEVVTRQGVAGSVLRPGYVYGGNGGKYLASNFAISDEDKNKQLIVKGNAKRTYSYIHVDDVGEAFAAVASAANGVVAHEIYNIGDEVVVEWRKVVYLMAKAAGWKGPSGHAKDDAEDVKEVERDGDAWSRISDVSCVTSSEKLRREVGWRATRRFLTDIDTYYRSWKVAQETQ